ncbi:discoidin domain-containing protein [Microbacterium trichothecenolyticum]|uniref:F5/8 type C domain-containing protein n=1 Tax=Microbacterium trichothecenolyticum TaxID=69370 RepID=A0ABU0TZ12_MICTR|nr:discoidin domain-containing protein [Microbacterium trichothecenolyticum]MDQ1124755.1 hypothetical protein [Microbacterium trichothecenolyticum]
MSPSKRRRVDWQQDRDNGPSAFRRRTVLTATAWSIPVLSLSAALPAHAATSDAVLVSLSFDSPGVLRGCMVRAIATVVTSSGAPVAGASVVFTPDSGATVLGSRSATTDGSGRAAVLIDISLANDPGMHAVTATSQGRSSSATYEVVVSPRSAPFDWRARAIAYDAFVYDWSQPGEYPTIARDTTHRNMDAETYKMPSYYGQPIPGDGGQEAITQLPSVVGATLVGIDKSDQGGRDYVDMCRTFFQPRIGVGLNNPGSGGGGQDSFWYPATANFMLSALAMLYPRAAHYDDIFRSIADKHEAMVRALGGSVADFTGQGFDFETMTLSRGSRNEGGDAAAATAVILMWAHSRFGDARYLEAAQWALGYLDRSSQSLNYEWATLLAPSAAARLNATAASSFDVRKHLMFVLQQSSARWGWGTITGSWSGYDVWGLQGSVTDGSGYAFAMGSFATAFLAPTVKYDVRYVDLVGPLLASVADAARFFYADHISTTKQIYGTRFSASPAKVIAYEGFRAQEAGVRPRATGDPSAYGRQWGLPPQTTDLGLYGSGWVGIFASTVEIVRSGLVRIDVDALDLGAGDGLRRSVYVNTATSGIDVAVPVHGSCALYDVLTDTVLTDDASGQASIPLPPGAARLVVELPPHPRLERRGGRTFFGNAVVNYRAAVPDEAAGRPVTASSTAPDSRVDNVVDDEPSTSWTSAQASDQWLSVDLREVRFVSTVSIDWVRAARSVRVDSSTDGSTWSQAVTVQATPGTQSISFPAIFARFVRLSAMTAVDGTAVSISSLRVTSDDLAARALTVASTSVNANTGQMVTDGDAGTRWESGSGDTQWILVDLGHIQTVNRVLLWWETASAKSYRIDSSLDAVTWATSFSTRSSSGGRETVDIAPVRARFLRVFCLERNTQWAYSIIALGVFAAVGS